MVRVVIWSSRKRPEPSAPPDIGGVRAPMPRWDVQPPESTPGVGALPDLDAIGGGQIHALPGLDAEGVIPCGEVADRRRAIATRRVAIGQYLVAIGRLPRVAAIVLRETQEEALVAGEAVDNRGRTPA